MGFCFSGDFIIFTFRSTDPTKSWYETGIDLNPRGGKKKYNRQNVKIPFQSNFVAMVDTGDARRMGAECELGREQQYMLTGDLWHTG